MSLYVAGQATALAVGQQQQLAGQKNLGAPYTTPAVAVGREPGNSETLSLTNTTGQTATVQVSMTDTDAGFLPLTDADTGTAITCANNTAIVFRCIGPFVRLSFAAEPGTGGAVVLAR